MIYFIYVVISMLAQLSHGEFHWFYPEEIKIICIELAIELVLLGITIITEKRARRKQEEAKPPKKPYEVIDIQPIEKAGKPRAVKVIDMDAVAEEYKHKVMKTKIAELLDRIDCIDEQLGYAYDRREQATTFSETECLDKKIRALRVKRNHIEQLISDIKADW